MDNTKEILSESSYHSTTDQQGINDECVVSNTTATTSNTDDGSNYSEDKKKGVECKDEKKISSQCHKSSNPKGFAKRELSESLSHEDLTCGLERSIVKRQMDISQVHDDITICPNDLAEPIAVTKKDDPRSAVNDEFHNDALIQEKKPTDQYEDEVGKLKQHKDEASCNTLYEEFKELADIMYPPQECQAIDVVPPPEIPPTEEERARMELENNSHLFI